MGAGRSRSTQETSSPSALPALHELGDDAGHAAPDEDAVPLARGR